MTKRARPPAGNEASVSLVLLGRINAAQGLRGEVRITSFTEDPESIVGYGSLTDGEGRSFTIESLRVIKGSVLAARLSGVADRTAAEKLKGTELFVDKALLPPAGENEWYYDDLVGLKAETPDGEVIGDIAAVQNYGAGDLLEIRSRGSKETLLIPFTETTVPKVDVAGGRVVVVLPDEVDDAEE
jgi:16S rRNA processing protein RimM